ncbi:MAG: S8 family serine peptidase, partial [Micromonosporaceae bacterium]|nr:S8 family serine peptidase [Micromonosporaceae bacterium]
AASRVVADLADFTDNPAGPRDGHGHGTHVAATVAGTGAASDGLRRGVAPGADLLIGKVCNDAGSCPFDAIVAGMEWAASSGARVISMSISAGPTDGTDLLSQAVNQVSRATGVLFVIAAGNGGPAPRTVSAPGTADEALAVAAVDDDGEMADFSARGPRPGDDAAKPDIAAPGVSIVAARAAGTAMGRVVDEHYTAASGTSMATPHVAGAAAVVTQRYPELTGREIKALLMDAAVDLGHDLFAQGEGLLDVAAAADRTVATGGPVSFGRLTYPHQPVTRTVTYTNLTDQPVPLSLAATLGSENGTPAPDGLLTVTPAEVTVPAGGTAQATLTLDGRVLGEDGVYGRYRGGLTATDQAGAVQASDRVTALLEAQRYEVSVGIVPPEGATDLAYGGIVVLPVDDQVHLHDEPVLLDGGPATATALYAGAYAVATSVGWRDAAGEWHTALVTEPEVTVAGPTPVRFDLREARPVAAELPQSTETNSATMRHRRTSTTGTWSLEGVLSGEYGAREPHWWTLPTEPVHHGTFRYINAQVRVPSLVTMRALGGGAPLDLHPRYVAADLAVAGQWQTWGDGAASGEARQTVPLVAHLPEQGTLPVVYAGGGTAGELAGAGVDGALVLLTPTDICGAACDYLALKERVSRAAEQGAVGVIVAGNQGQVELGRPSTSMVDCGDGPEGCPDPEPYSAVPLVSVPATQAARLVDRLARAAPVRVRLGGEPEVPEVYALSFVAGQVPSALPHRVGARDLERVEHRVHGTRPGMLSPAGVTWARAVPALARESEPALSLPRVATGRTLTMLVGPPQAEALDRFRLGTVYFDQPHLVSKPGHLRNLSAWAWPTEVQEVVLDGPTTITWNSGPLLPGAHTGDHTGSGFGTDWGYCVGCREGDRFWPVMTLTRSTGSFQDRVVGLVNDTGAGNLLFPGVGCEPPTCTVTLYDQAGEEIPQQLVPVGFTVGGTGTTADSGR